MVRRQKERLFESSREQKANRSTTAAAAGAALSSSATNGAVQRLLPFSHCALQWTPYSDPVICSGSSAGIIYDSSALLPFVLRHGADPATGEARTSRDIVTLRMDRNDEGLWQCPVLTKPFTGHTKIVAIRHGSEANVVSYEAFHELCLKTKNYVDLISGEPFDVKKDVIVLFDPTDDALNRRRDMNTFYHVTHARELKRGDGIGTSGSNIKHSVTASRIMEKLQAKKKSSDKINDDNDDDGKKRKAMEAKELPASKEKDPVGYYREDTGERLNVLAEDVTGVALTELAGGAAASFTSTASAVSGQNRGRLATDEEILQSQFRAMRKRKRKGCVQLHVVTGGGTGGSGTISLTLELHCDVAPRACANFLGLCQKHEYDGSVFHRLIPSFMIQGGRKSGSGASDGQEDDDNNNVEDESLWGGPFADEFDDRLKHSGAGVVSMANAGPGTNRRQFFVTFKTCSHLDRKHTVFGAVVDGKEALARWETIPIDRKERPKEEIKIVRTTVLVDPALEAREIEQRRLEKIVGEREGWKKAPASAAAAKQLKSESQENQSVGRYLAEKIRKTKKTDKGQRRDDAAPDDDDGRMPSRLPPPPKKTTFGDFSGW
jgi:peptidyl-prolyl cis-trans isomerase-like 2